MSGGGRFELVSEDLLGLDDGFDPLEQLWRVATWEYDCATARTFWFDAPATALGIDDATAEMILEPVLASVRMGAPWEFFEVDRSVDGPAGRRIDFRVQARHVFAPDGAIAGCVGIVTDVTEQRRTEQSLRGVIDRFRRLVELNPDAVVVHQAGIVRYASPAGLDLVRVTDPADIVGRTILDFLHPSSLESTLERIAGLTEPGMVSEPAEAVLVRADGSLVVVESVSVRIDWDGEPAFQVILRDVSERWRAEAALRYQASLVAQVSDAIVATDAEGRIQSWNPAAAELYGWGPSEVMGWSLPDVMGSAAVAVDGTPKAGKVLHRTARGDLTPVLVSVAPLRDELGKEAGSVAICRDLSEKMELRAAEERFAAVVAALDEGVLVVDGTGCLTSFNTSARELLGDWLFEGIPAEEILLRWPWVAEDGGKLAPDAHPLAVCMEGGEAQRHVVVGFADAGDLRWVSMSVRHLEGDAGRSGGVVCSFTEVTERKHVEEQLNFQASHDGLTQLPNRTVICDAIEAELGRAGEAGDSVAVVLLDLDRLKIVNDSLGHLAGDAVLREVAGRLVAGVRPGDHVGRLAGDEFVVVCPGVSDVEEAVSLTGDLAKAVAEPVRLPGGREVVVTASVGVACVGRGVVPELALANADAAMYRAKQRGRARIEVFDADLASRVSRQVEVHDALRRAVTDGAIEPHFQPIIDVESGVTVGYEALARWHEPDIGPVSPAEFIAAAEDIGLMAPLGAEILRQACEWAARWGTCGDAAPVVSVNVSPRQLADPDVVNVVAGALDATGLDPGRLWLEVTESVLVEEAMFVSAALRELQGLGVHLAIDDFGTGYSSLAYLKQFPVEALKIDRSFVEGLGSDSESDAIVEAIIRLAQTLGLQTIAEGVETAGQLARLRELECGLAQGFLFSPAVPGAEVTLTH